MSYNNFVSFVVNVLSQEDRGVLDQERKNVLRWVKKGIVEISRINNLFLEILLTAFFFFLQ